MQVHKSKQFLPLNLEESWDFFSRPENLSKITPPSMGFHITSGYNDGEMYAGMIITYKVRPLLKIPLNWMTEITHVRKPYYFIDNQKKGPFALWHHQHHFQEVDNGVLMRDIVHYAAPLGFLGVPIENWVIKKRVEEIFTYRRRVLENMFAL